MGLLAPTAATPPLQPFLLCSKPPSAACCTLGLARCVDPLRTGQHAPLPHRRLSRGSPYRWGKSAPTRQGRAAHLSRALGQPFLSPRGPTCSSSQLLRAAAAAAAGRCTHLKDRSETERFDYWVCSIVCAADPWCCEENENACKNRRCEHIPSIVLTISLVCSKSFNNSSSFITSL